MGSLDAPASQALAPGRRTDLSGRTNLDGPVFSGGVHCPDRRGPSGQPQCAPAPAVHR